MYNHEEKFIVNHNKEKVYSLVANVEDYPKFIPWCTKVKLLNVKDNIHTFKLYVKFNLFSTSFTTADTFYPHDKIEINLVDGPFKHLYSEWIFEEHGENQTMVDFKIHFAFKSKILDSLLGKVFIEANSLIVKSFLKKIDEI